MSGINDPFAFDQSTDPQQGALGVAPSAWQHLAMFGSNLTQAANARLPSGHLANGTGFMGPFGAATGATMQQAMQQAQTGAQIRHANAQTQGMNLQNQLNAVNVPLQIQQAQLMAAFRNNPELYGQYIQKMQQAMGGGMSADYGAGAYSGAPGGGYGQGGDPTQAMHRLEYNGPPGTSPGMYMDGNGMAAGPTSVHQAALTDFNTANKTNYSLNDLASNPQLGTQVGDWYLHRQVERFGPRMGLAAYNAGPGRVGQAMQSGQGMAGLPPSTQNYVNRGVGMMGGQPQPQPAGYQPQGAVPPPGMPIGSVPDNQALGLFRRYGQNADTIDALKGIGLPTFGDPAFNRSAALEYQKVGLAGAQSYASSQGELPAKLAGEGFQQGPNGTQMPITGGKADPNYQANVERRNTIAHGVQPTMDRNGNLYQLDANGNVVPLGRGSEVKPGYNSATGDFDFRDVGGQGVGAPSQIGKPYVPGAPGGGAAADPVVVAHPGPANEGFAKGAADVQKGFIDHDNKMVDEDLAHVIENVTPAKQQLFQLRALNDQGASTGAAAELRMNFKNWVNTFAPDFASQITGDASPMQEFKKIALMGAGKQERGDLGARGGFRAMELYLSANPNLENQPTANRDMANALLISHQYHEDYARGATDFFNKQIQGVQQANSTKGYQKVSNYDQAYIEKMRPELYASAISAINGKPFAEWSKGRTPAQIQIIGGILQRADPNAVVDVHGKQFPVTSFQSTIGPTDIMGGGNGR